MDDARRADYLLKWAASTVNPGATLARHAAELEAALAARDAEIERLRSVIESKHGGEPLALLDELDAARAEVARLRRVLGGLAGCKSADDQDGRTCIGVWPARSREWCYGCIAYAALRGEEDDRG